MWTICLGVRSSSAFLWDAYVSLLPFCGAPFMYCMSGMLFIVGAHLTTASYHGRRHGFLYMYVCFACQGLDEEHLSRLKGRRAALLAAREARERGDDSEDFIALDGKVSLNS